MDQKDKKNIKQYEGVLCLNTTVGDNVILGKDAFIKDSVIGNYCTIERRGMIFNSRIGDYSYTGYNTVVKYATLGKFCSISWNVSIGGANHDLKHLTTHPFPFIEKFGLVDGQGGGYDSFNEPLEIGNDVWIGSNVCVLRNVKIGDGAVVGAGAVVTHDIPPYEIWAGVPAKKIGQRFSDEIISELMDLKWWNLPKNLLSSHMDMFKKDITLEDIKEFRGWIKKYTE